MNKTLFFLFVFFLSSISFSQDLELFGGSLVNKVYIQNPDIDGTWTNQSSHDGYSVGIGIRELQVDSIPMRFTVRLNKYGNYIGFGESLSFGEFSSEVEVHKHTLNLGLFPLRVQFTEKLKLYLGAEFGFMLKEATVGHHTFIRYNDPSTYENLDGRDKHVNQRITFGASGNISYNIGLKSNWSLLPQIDYYFGLFDEFALNASTKSHQFSFKMGLAHSLD